MGNQIIRYTGPRSVLDVGHCTWGLAACCSLHGHELLLTARHAVPCGSTARNLKIKLMGLRVPLRRLWQRRLNSCAHSFITHIGVVALSFALAADSILLLLFTLHVILGRWETARRLAQGQVASALPDSYIRTLAH